MRADDFDYDLPEELIAQEPAARRRDARLLHLPADGPVAHRVFAELPRLLRAGDVLVRNETRVIPARVHVRRESGGAVEVFLVRHEEGHWRAMLRPARRLRVGETLIGEDFSIRVDEIGATWSVVRILPAHPYSEADVLARHARVPLPPYIRREPTAADAERYQTVFARDEGAVAAPTAGLHFDDELLAEIEAAGVAIAGLVLHVGPGTFQPLPDDTDLADHRLDPERFRLPAESARAILEARTRGGRVVAVGTTAVRTLETWAAAGSPETGLAGETELFIREPFRFHAVDALVTNFHLPRSSLLCLVAAFAGRDRVLAAYREAVAQRYRFYSYGDATFLERKPR
ncbi:MAG: tRNA preQ1(34) S-adenosylmethionine ribosyltransferase-isomerase QueA [bacterium]